MNWNNLTKNKCPNCNKDFMKGLTVSKSTGVMHHPCGFMISERKYAEISSKITGKSLDLQ